jgi:CRP-like cAMP-binding protein
VENIYLLKNCKLFKNIKDSDITYIFSKIRYKIKKFGQNEIILSEYDKAEYLGIVIDGIAEIQKSLPSGKNILIKVLRKYQTFGEATLFSSIESFPVKVISKNKSKVIMIKKQEMIKLLSINEKVINNFLEIISNRIIMLKSRLELISESSIRKKISSYLLNEVNRKKTNTFYLPFSKTKLASFLSIPRPSLSRELKRMKEDGLLSYDRRKITIKDISKLEFILFQ